MAQEYILPGEIVGYTKNTITHYQFYDAVDDGIDGTALLTKFEIAEYNRLLEQLKTWNAEINYRGTYHRQSASIDGTNLHALCQHMENAIIPLSCGQEECTSCRHSG